MSDTPGESGNWQIGPDGLWYEVSDSDVPPAGYVTTEEFLAIPELVEGRYMVLEPLADGPGGQARVRADVVDGIERTVSIPDLANSSTNANDSATAHSLLTATANLAADLLADLGSLVRLMASGSHLNNSGGTAAETFRITMEGATIATFSVPALAANAATRAWRMEMELKRIIFGAAPAVAGVATMRMGDPTAGTTDTWSKTVSILAATTLGAIAGGLEFDITVQHATAHAQISTQALMAKLGHTPVDA